jgi:hypothetical protein
VHSTLSYLCRVGRAQRAETGLYRSRVREFGGGGNRSL